MSTIVTNNITSLGEEIYFQYIFRQVENSIGVQ